MTLQRPRSRTIALLALAFAAGAAGGVAADRWLTPPPALRTRITHDMSGVLDGLDLTPEQRRRAEGILQASAPRTEEAMRTAASQLRSVADSVDRELRAILTPEQRRRLDALGRQPVFMLRRKTPDGRDLVDTLRDPIR